MKLTTALATAARKTPTPFGAGAWSFVLCVALVLSLASGAIGLVAHQASAKLDQNALNKQLAIARSVLATKRAALTVGIADYARSDELYRRLGQGLGHDWADRKIGPAVAQAHALDAILLLDAAGTPIYSHLNPSISSGLKNTAGFSKFVRDALSASPRKAAGVRTAHVAALGTIHVAAIARVGPQESLGKDTRAFYLLWVHALNQQRLDVLAKDFNFKGLRMDAGWPVKPNGPPGSVPLRDVTGEITGWLEWDPEMPSVDFYADLMRWAPIVLVLAVLALSTLALLWSRVHVQLTRTRSEMSAAVDASRMKSMFLASMSHELRTPLNAIIGFSDILRLGMYGPLGSRKYEEYVKHIQTSGTHLLGIINQIMNLAKIESGSTELQRQPVSIVELVQEALRMAESEAKAKRLTLDLEATGRPSVWGDAVAIRQILINLIGNAIKYTDDGHVRVGVEHQADGRVRVDVSDTGIGIPADKLDKIGTPFFQDDNAYLSARGGVGLGLTITKALLARMGGALTFASAHGRGTTATLHLDGAPPESLDDAGITQPAADVARDTAARAYA